jgi:mRNA interferase HigB
VRVVAWKTLLRFIDSLSGEKSQKVVKSALEAWRRETKIAQWANPAKVKASYITASIIGGNRVVFNIKGNDYRLVTAIDYRRQIVFIKWIGSHREYDKIDARTIEYGD